MAFTERGLPDHYCWVCGGAGDPDDPQGCYTCGAVGFTDDLRGLSRDGQIARVQAVARERGDRQAGRDAGQASSLRVTQAPGDRAGPQGGDGAEAEAG
jgi:hypothetical protein